MHKKLCENRKKLSENRYIHVEKRGATRILFYSIGAVVPVFIIGIRIKEIECAFSFQRFWLKKVHSSRCVVHNWEEIESLKNEKILEKSWNSVFPFPYEPCLNITFSLLSVSCLVVELFCSHTHDRYANSMLYK